MVYKIIMPKLVETMEEGTIVQWLKSEGDKVSKGEPLLVVEMVKTTMEVPSPASGYLRSILFGEGETVEVTKPIAYIAGDMGEAIPGITTEISGDSGGVQPPVSGQERDYGGTGDIKAGIRVTQGDVDLGSDPQRIKVSPVARKLAEEHGIHLQLLQGSGPGGRIVEADVRKAIDDKPQIMKMTRIREIIAKRMSESKKTIPHFYVTVEVDMSQAVELRSRLNLPAKFSYNDLVVKAVADALREYPQVNSKFSNGSIVLQDEIGIGIAVNVDDGLLVPVVRNADQKSIFEISLECSDLIEKAHNGSIVPYELSGGTFTVTNMGMLGVHGFAAIINPPEVGILAVGMITPRPVIRDNSIVQAHMMNLTLSVDHRVIDGALAARFLNSVKLRLEDPQKPA